MSFVSDFLQNFCKFRFTIIQLALLDFQTDALRMAVKFRSVHALHMGHTGLIFSTVLNPNGIFEDIGALGQIIQIEMECGVTGGLVIAQTILIFVSGNDIDRFSSASTMVLHVNIFHVPVSTQFDPHDQFISHFYGTPNR